MSFISLTFAIFMASVLAVYYLLPQRFRNALLLAASYAFYMYSSPLFAAYLAAVTLIGYFGALGISRAQNERGKNIASALSALAVIAGLLVFKYFDFFSSSFTALFSPEAQPILLGVAAPLGISFFTFQTLGYIFDVRRGKCDAVKSIVDYAAFISFFPQILSGPIARTDTVLPQFFERHDFKAENLRLGLWRFFLGLFKKAVVADWLKVFVDAFYYDVSREAPLTLLAAVFLFALELYFDFSAYCDMALGCAKLLGFTLEENFLAPYYSKSFREIWSRWHVTLMDWLRDYVYIPLGGSRVPYARKLLNLLAVFLISGLWHGAAWSFVVWGLFFGVLRIFEDVLFRRAPKDKKSSEPVRLLKNIAVVLLWSFGFVFFRADSVSQGLSVIRGALDFSGYSYESLYTRIKLILEANITSSPEYIKAVLLTVIFSAAFILLLDYIYIYKERAHRAERCNLLANLPTAARWACCFVMTAALLVCGVFGSSSFIYFNF